MLLVILALVAVGVGGLMLLDTVRPEPMCSEPVYLLNGILCSWEAFAEWKGAPNAIHPFEWDDSGVPRVGRAWSMGVYGSAVAAFLILFVRWAQVSPTYEAFAYWSNTDSGQNICGVVFLTAWMGLILWLSGFGEV